MSMPQGTKYIDRRLIGTYILLGLHGIVDRPIHRVVSVGSLTYIK
ncbi:hypothetical protein VPHF99_0282 [Vibrio phage F99]